VAGCDETALSDALKSALDQFETSTLVQKVNLFVSDLSFMVWLYGLDGSTDAFSFEQCYCTLPASQYLSADIWKTFTTEGSATGQIYAKTSTYVSALYSDESFELITDLVRADTPWSTVNTQMESVPQDTLFWIYSSATQVSRPTYQRFESGLFEANYPVFSTIQSATSVDAWSFYTVLTTATDAMCGPQRNSRNDWPECSSLSVSL
jgi:hypothetical protein